MVVGAGLAGARAAQTLRREGYEGRIVLVGQEDVRPYDRPPLSKAFLTSGAGFDQLALHKPNFYESKGIELVVGTAAVVLDVAARQVELSSGECLCYDQVLLATGASPRRLRVPGAGLAGVCYLRDLHDAGRLRAALGAGTRLVVVGAGWIGCEVAAAARALGAQVSVVDVLDAPLARVLGPEVGALFARLHADHGVRLHMGTGVEEIRGAGSVEEVRLADGSALGADVVVVGVGVVPRAGLAAAAGVEVDDGVVVDEHLGTSAPGVWAAGDVASAYHPHYGRHVRLEHWAAAAHQGPVAARNMLGASVAYERLPYFWSEQYDLSLEYTGYAPRWDQVVLRGELGQADFGAFWLEMGRVVAAMCTQEGDMVDQLDAVLRSGSAIEPGRLADPGASLVELARRG